MSPRRRRGAAATRLRRRFKERFDREPPVSLAEYARPSDNVARWSWRRPVLREDDASSPALETLSKTVFVRRYAFPLRDVSKAKQDHIKKVRAAASLSLSGGFRRPSVFLRPRLLFGRARLPGFARRRGPPRRRSTPRTRASRRRPTRARPRSGPGTRSSWCVPRGFGGRRRRSVCFFGRFF